MSELDLDDLWASLLRQFRVDLCEKTVDVVLDVYDSGSAEIHFSGVTSVVIERRNVEPWELVELTEIEGHEEATGFRFVLSFFGDADRAVVTCAAFHVDRAASAAAEGRGLRG